MKNRKKLLAILILVISVLGFFLSSQLNRERIPFSGITVEGFSDKVMVPAGILLMGIIIGIMMLCKCKIKFFAIPVSMPLLLCTGSIINEESVNVAGDLIIAAICLLLAVHFFLNFFSSRKLAVVLGYLAVIYCGGMFNEYEELYGEGVILLGAPHVAAAMVLVLVMAYFVTQEEDKHLNVAGLTGVLMSAAGELLALVALIAYIAQDKPIPTQTEGWEGALLYLGMLLMLLALFVAPLVVLRSKKDTKAIQQAQATQAEIPASQQPQR